MWIVALVALGFSIAAGRLAWQMRGQLPRPSVRGVARLLHTLRKSRRLPLWLKFLHVLGWSLVFLSAAMTFAGVPAAGQWVMMPAVLVFFVAGIYDLTIRIKFVVRRVWSDLLGKLFAVSFGAALALIALALAKAIVHDITHIDPKYLLESTGALAALLLPVVYCMFGICVLFVLFVVQLLALFGVMTASLMVEYLRPLLEITRRERLRLLLHRIIHGKKPPGGKLPRRAFVRIDDLSMFARPVSTAAVIMLAAGLLAESANAASALRQSVRYAIVWMEYRDGSSCLNLSADARIVYMEDGKVSVAPGQTHHRDFEVKKCALTPADEGAGAPSAGL